MSDYLERVRQACLDRCPAILHDWLPGGHAVGKGYQCASISGGRGDSLKVNLVKGLWKDWSTDQPGGDLVSLYAATKHFTYRDAVRELAAQFGIQPDRSKAAQKVSWQCVLPVPEGVYAVSGTGEPLLPDDAFGGNVAASWAYLDKDFNLLCFIARFDPPDGPKKFSWLTYQRNKANGQCSWQKLGLPHPWPLYGLELLSQSPDKVLIVSGEKCADAGRRVFPDWCVITWPGGDQNVHNADWSPLAILADSRIVLWPDNDVSCQTAMSHVAECLKRPTEVVRCDPSWPEHYDIADMQKEKTPEEIRAFLNSNLQSVAVTVQALRPLVILNSEPYHDSQAIYDAMKELEQEVFYADGPIYLRTNIYGHTEVHPFTARSFSAWAGRRLDICKSAAHGRTFPCSLPEALSDIILFHSKEYFPHLRFFADTPVFCPDGELLTKQGYNPKAQAYINLPRGYENGLPIEQAWELVDDLIADFPFETPSDRAAAISYVLTAIVRHAIPGPTPLYRFEAPDRGTGKTILCTILTEILTPSLKFYPLPEREEEMGKLLTTILMKIPTVTVFDNIERLDSQRLEMALTADIWGDRKLGGNEDCSVPVMTVWAATLNNLPLKASMFRRSVRVRLNAKVEHPEKRQTKWRHPHIKRYARTNRATLLSAFVSMASYGMNGETAPAHVTMGSYEEWSSRMSQILELNGIDGFLGEVEHDRVLASDPSEDAVRELVDRWADRFGGNHVEAKQILELASEIESLPIWYSPTSGKPSARSFGRLLSGLHGRVISGCEVAAFGAHGHKKLYKLIGKERVIHEAAVQGELGESDSF